MSYNQPLRAWETVLLYLALAAAALFPVLSVDFPPLADLPNHLARVHIMDGLATAPDLARHYAVEWQLLSFQSSDLILPPLAKLVGLEAAARIFIVATFATLLGGTFALHKVLFGRVGLWPAIAFLLLYNYMLGWGLVSFLFTAGLALILLAVWIHTAKQESMLRSAALAAAALAIFFCHLLAFAIFALAALAFELWRWRQNRAGFSRNMALCAAVFVTPGVLFLIAPRPTIPMLNAYGTFIDKFRAVLAPFNMYFGWLDWLLALTALILAVVVLVLAAIGKFPRPFPVAAPLQWPLSALIVAAILMPNNLMSVWGTDFRLPTVVLLLLIAGTDLPFRTRKRAALFVACVGALLLVRVGTVTADWRRMDADISAFRAALDVIDRGSKVVVVQSFPHDVPPAPNLYAYRHFAAFAVIDRDVFLPHLFSAATPLRFISPGGHWTTGQLAVVRDPEWHPGEVATSAEEYKLRMAVRNVTRAIQTFDLATSTVDWTDWPEQFDYLIVFDYGQFENPVPALLTELRRGSCFTIFRIRPPDR
jgi:hypothetical protein